MALRLGKLCGNGPELGSAFANGYDPLERLRERRLPKSTRSDVEAA